MVNKLDKFNLTTLHQEPLFPKQPIEIHQIVAVGITHEEHNRKSYAQLDNGMYIENAMESHKDDFIGIEILDDGNRIRIFNFYANGEVRSATEQFRHFPNRYFLEPPIPKNLLDYW